MAAIDFPAAPSVGQAFTAGNGVTYTWNGLLWVASGASAGGDFCASYTGASFGMTATPTPLICATIISGNSGGWYNTSNGRFTPPAGRYHIGGVISAGSASTVSTWAVASIWKNGVLVNQSIGTPVNAIAWYLPVSISAVVDANGTDYFELRHAAQAASNTQVVGTYCSMWAYPISGIKGPPGDFPSGLKLYDEQVLASPANQIIVTCPAGAKLVQLEVDAQVTGGTSENINVQAMAGGSPIAIAGYSYQTVIGQGATAAGITNASGGAWFIGSAIRLVASMRGSLAPSTSNDWVLFTGTSGSTRPSDRLVYTWEWDLNQTGVRSTVTGFRIYTATAINFLAGSSMRCLVVV